ncbi:hypothetical protein ACQKP8_23610 [Photobacterium alginatilyticum]|uniref:hypothetical protein n=1 Tax=Photobacterium alginatilyticum TaxID=1775171 RepID=UPI0040676FB1
MSKLTWSVADLSTLGRVYLRHVLGKMRDIDGSTAQFGLLGKGLTPNYQITFPNGLVRCFRGMNHQAADVDDFKEGNISEPFTLAQIKEAFEASNFS